MDSIKATPKTSKSPHPYDHNSSNSRSLIKEPSISCQTCHQSTNAPVFYAMHAAMPLPASTASARITLSAAGGSSINIPWVSLGGRRRRIREKSMEKIKKNKTDVDDVKTTVTILSIVSSANIIIVSNVLKLCILRANLPITIEQLGILHKN